MAKHHVAIGVSAPEVVPEAGASPVVAFHNENLTLPERMKIADEMGADLKMKLFAAMAHMAFQTTAILWIFRVTKA